MRLGELVGRGIADRVGNVDGGGARLDGGLDAAAEEVGSVRVASIADHSTSSV